MLALDRTLPLAFNPSAERGRKDGKQNGSLQNHIDGTDARDIG